MHLLTLNTFLIAYCKTRTHTAASSVCNSRPILLHQHVHMPKEPIRCRYWRTSSTVPTTALTGSYTNASEDNRKSLTRPNDYYYCSTVAAFLTRSLSPHYKENSSHLPVPLVTLRKREKCDQAKTCREGNNNVRNPLGVQARIVTHCFGLRNIIFRVAVYAAGPDVPSRDGNFFLRQRYKWHYNGLPPNFKTVREPCPNFPPTPMPLRL